MPSDRVARRMCEAWNDLRTRAWLVVTEHRWVHQHTFRTNDRMISFNGLVPSNLADLELNADERKMLDEIDPDDPDASMAAAYSLYTFEVSAAGLATPG